MRVVIDTNVFVSSFFNPHGKPRKVIDLWKTGEIILCLSPEIIEEYFVVLGRLGLEGEPELDELLGLFRSKPNILLTVLQGNLRAVASDPADDMFIECAIRAKSEFIISGDRHLQELEHYGDVPILPPDVFLKRYHSAI
jgi:hypothetical protein